MARLSTVLLLVLPACGDIAPRPDAAHPQADAPAEATPDAAPPDGPALGRQDAPPPADASPDARGPISSGPFTEFPIPSGHAAHFITVGPDGNLWFSEIDDRAVGRMTLDGVATVWPSPSRSDPYDIVAGPD